VASWTVLGECRIAPIETRAYRVVAGMQAAVIVTIPAEKGIRCLELLALVLLAGRDKLAKSGGSGHGAPRRVNRMVGLSGSILTAG
jgi:hypothetical protein